MRTHNPETTEVETGQPQPADTRQSAALNLLLDDLSRPEAQKALKVIQAGSWLDDLRAAHELFERTYIEKVAAESQQDFPSLRDARGRLVDHVETLLGSVEVLRQSIERDGTDAELATLGELVEQLKEIITEVMTVARARRTRQSNSDSPEDAQEEALVATAS